MNGASQQLITSALGGALVIQGLLGEGLPDLHPHRCPGRVTA